MRTFDWLDTRTGPLGTAIFSRDGRYRYWLTRRLGKGKTVVWIMTNPSTADEKEDDATLRRCIDFSQREGAGWLIVVNHFAYVAKDPRELRTIADPVGPSNALFLAEAAKNVDLVVAAWGALPARYARTAASYLVMVSGLQDFYCLGTTKAGAPKHPLRLARTTPLVPWHPDLSLHQRTVLKRVADQK
jgi:hypothetical protein